MKLEKRELYYFKLHYIQDFSNEIKVKLIKTQTSTCHIKYKRNKRKMSSKPLKICFNYSSVNSNRK